MGALSVPLLMSASEVSLPLFHFNETLLCMRQGAQGWSTGMTLRDGMGGRWEGGSGWGTRVQLWLIHPDVWQKSLQYCKVISLQLK